MAVYKNEKDLCGSLLSTNRKVAKEVLALLNKGSETTLKNTARDFGVYQRAKIREIFNDAVNSFYNSYTPSYYERNFSLYNALQLEPGEGILEHEEAPPFESLFDSTKVTAFERGGGSEGLFEHVFKQGWHGGASGEDRTGKSVSTPHYRTPYGVYSHWGRPAVQSESPYDMFNERLLDAYHGEMSLKDKELLEYYNKITVDKVIAQIPSLFAKYS